MAGPHLIEQVAFEVDLDGELVSAARQELLARSSPDPRNGFRWGYLLGVEDAMPRARELAARLHARWPCSVVPHVGVDDEHGYFLSSYEAVAPVSPI